MNHPHPAPVQQLRQATQALHAELDRNLAIARPGTPLADYVAHLHSVSAWLADIQRLAPDLDRSARQDRLSCYDEAQRLLRRDLQAAGAEAAPQAVHGLPDEVSAAFLWGVDYVVKGSALGGIHLHRKLSQELPGQPLHYFAAAVAHGMQHWRQLQQDLVAQLADGTALQQAEDGAVWAFRHFMKLQAETSTAET